MEIVVKEIQWRACVARWSMESWRDEWCEDGCRSGTWIEQRLKQVQLESAAWSMVARLAYRTMVGDMEDE